MLPPPACLNWVYLNGLLDMKEDSSFVDVQEEDGNTIVTIKADFFVSGVSGAVTSSDLEITLMGVTGVADDAAAEASLFVDAPSA